jgi:tRNA1(Val) A37 N6-methylase TrmN6
MSEFGNPLSYKTGEKRFNLEEERKIEKFIEETALQAAIILAERHLIKDGKFSINYIKKKEKLQEEFVKLLSKNNHELATTLFGPTNKEDAPKKLADIGEKLWMK